MAKPYEARGRDYHDTGDSKNKVQEGARKKRRADGMWKRGWAYGGGKGDGGAVNGGGRGKKGRRKT
jgi:hypothetical protein